MKQKRRGHYFGSNVFLYLLGFGLLLISGILWKTQETAALERVKLETEIKGQSYKSEAEIRFQDIENALEGFSWVDIPIDIHTKSIWADNAAFYLDTFPGFESIAWVDASYKISFVVPETESERLVNKSPSVFSGNNTKESIWIPIEKNGDFSGYIVGVIDIESFFSPILDELGDDYAIRLLKDKTLIVETGLLDEKNDIFITSQQITLGGATILQMELTPTDEFIRSTLVSSKNTLITSLSFSTIAVISVFFAQRFNKQSLKDVQRYQDLFEVSRDAIFTFSYDGKIFEANQSMQKLTQFSLAELKEMNLGQLLSGYNMSNKIDLMAFAGESQGMDTTILRKDHFPVPIHVVISIIHQDEKDVFLLAIARDITDLKQVQEQLDAYNDQLEELVKIRTNQINEINKELSDFAYIVSHDLKAPLRGIMQLSTWIKEDFSKSLNGEANQLLDLLEKRTMRMHGLIQGILQYSRIGRVKEDERLIDLNQLINESIDMLMPPKNIDVSVEKNLPIIHGEYTKMVQVFQNLIGNAVKFMDKEEGSVNISCYENDESFTFFIKDNGPGIEEKYFEKIFEMFQTLHARDEFESTGLGLALVKKIIEYWGGKIWVESELGEGSTFCFTIPKNYCIKGVENE